MLPSPTPRKRPRKSTAAVKNANKKVVENTAARTKAEEELQWERWQKRIASLALTLVCLIASFNELVLTNEPSIAKLAAIGTFMGIPLVIGGRSGKP